MRYLKKPKSKVLHTFLDAFVPSLPINLVFFVHCLLKMFPLQSTFYLLVVQERLRNESGNALCKGFDQWLNEGDLPGVDKVPFKNALL